MQELHHYNFLMQFYHLLFIILHKFKKSFFFLKKIQIFLFSKSIYKNRVRHVFEIYLTL